MTVRLGLVVATPGALAALQRDGTEAQRFLERHAVCDWGDLSAEDRAQNDHALRAGLRLLSAYVLRGGERIWVITEADRSVTTVLLPEEY